MYPEHALLFDSLLKQSAPSQAVQTRILVETPSNYTGWQLAGGLQHSQMVLHSVSEKWSNIRIKFLFLKRH